MTVSPAVLQGGVLLTTSSVALYTAPAGTKAVIKRAVFSNYTVAPSTITVTITRSGGAALGIITIQPVAADSSYTAPELANLVLQTGDVVSAMAANLATVNAFISGFTVT